MNSETPTTRNDDGHKDTDPVAQDIEARNSETEDISAGEQVLDEGRVSPSQDDVGRDTPQKTSAPTAPAASAQAGESPTEREHAADERTDAAAQTIQPESS